MGYTHYFRTHKDGIPVAAWDKICVDVKALLTNLPANIEIAFEEDEPTRQPEVSDSLIRFNGIGNEVHETFYFERVPKPNGYGLDGSNTVVFAFCKTAYKPYDLVVCGVLIIIAKHAGRYVEVSSDGNLSDWKPAFEWVSSILGQEYAAGSVAPRLTGHFQLGGIPEDIPVSA